MNLCPKCGGLVKSEEATCPKCNTLLVKDNVEILDLELPITKEEKELEIIETPLYVKKDNIIEEKNNLTKFNIVLTVLSILTLITTIIILATNILIELDKEEIIIKEELFRNNGLYSDFISTENELLSINEDNTFALYNNYKILDNNYYKGTYEYKTGEAAIYEMGYSIEEFNKEFTNTDINNVYSLKLKPLKSYFHNQNNDIKENEIWWLILIINEDNIYAYNETLDIRYNFIRK